MLALVRQWIPVHASVLFIRLVDIISTPLVSGSHLFGASPDEYMAWIFWETTSGIISVCSALDSTVDYMHCVSLRCL